MDIDKDVYDMIDRMDWTYLLSYQLTLGYICLFIIRSFQSTTKWIMNSIGMSIGECNSFVYFALVL